jgi:hypothetical protein
MRSHLKVTYNKYWKFFIRISTILFIVAMSDLLIGNLLRHFYFTQVAGQGYRTTYALDSTNADILVFGSSRANHHYVPEIFEDSLKRSFYNTGRDGNFLLYNYAVFKTIVKRFTPKIVIFDINPEELYYDAESYERLSSLLPYYRNHPEIRDIVNMKSPFEKFKLISSIYPFNSSFLTIVIGNMEENKQRKSERKGYIPLYNLLIDTTLKTTQTLEGTIDINKVNAIKDIMKYCLNHNINLVFIQSPIYGIVESPKTINTIEQMAKMNHVIFWNFSNDADFLSTPKYFQDQFHLNEIGANWFSKIVVKKIIEEEYVPLYHRANQSVSTQTQH